MFVVVCVCCCVDLICVWFGVFGFVSSFVVVWFGVVWFLCGACCCGVLFCCAGLLCVVLVAFVLFGGLRCLLRFVLLHYVRFGWLCSVWFGYVLFCVFVVLC